MREVMHVMYWCETTHDQTKPHIASDPDVLGVRDEIELLFLPLTSCCLLRNHHRHTAFDRGINGVQDHVSHPFILQNFMLHSWLSISHRGLISVCYWAECSFHENAIYIERASYFYQFPRNIRAKQLRWVSPQRLIVFWAIFGHVLCMYYPGAFISYITGKCITNIVI